MGASSRYWEDLLPGSVVLPDEPPLLFSGIDWDVPEPVLPPELLPELPGGGVDGVTPFGVSDVPSVVPPEVPPDGEDGAAPGALPGLVEGAALGADGGGGGVVWVDSGEPVAPPDCSLPPLPPPRLQPANARESRPISNAIFEAWRFDFIIIPFN